MVTVAALQIVFWCSLEFTKEVTLAQLNVLNYTTHASSFLHFAADVSYPVIQLLSVMLLYCVYQYLRLASRHSVTPLQIIGLGYGVRLCGIRDR